ncbi:MAG: hypothetical protein C0463_09095 [Idiomarina sp.]|nr:hypothetical protein [Idiomarina sp.]
MTEQLSATESELKFTLREADVEALLSFLDQHSQPQPTLHLSNAYFDTPSGDLHRLKIGCRTRRWRDSDGEQAEQTIKLAGSVVNGLHQRPEYNLPQEKQENPDLTRFDSQIWPSELDVTAVNKALTRMFKVDFERRRWHWLWSNSEQHSNLEIVLDQGFILAGGEQERIFEVEIELLDGAIDGLFAVAKILSTQFNLTECNESKAQRGFALAARAASPRH